MLENKKEKNDLESMKKCFTKDSRRANSLKAISPRAVNCVKALQTRVLSRKGWSNSVKYTHNYPPCSRAFVQFVQTLV